MEKSRMRPVKAGKGVRMTFSRQKEVLEMPNLIEIQKNSYQWFLDEGLREVFADISPIADFAGHLSLDFVDFTLCKDDIKYTIEECKERDATYAAPLKVKVRLCNKDKDEINEHEIFMGDLPLMTDTGSFVINGAERVIVSQLVRSPGIYYGIAHDKIGTELYSCTVIPNRGAWLEYETDSNDIFYVRVDRTRKVPVTVLIRALGYGTNAEIIELFGEELKLEKSFEKDPSSNYQDGLLELYKKIRPGEPLSVDSAESLLNSMFFDPRRYDLAKVGRYKFNKKLHFKNRIAGHTLAEDVVDMSTGEILAEKGTEVDKQLATDIQNAAIPYVWIQGERKNHKVLSNMMVDLASYVESIVTDLYTTAPAAILSVTTIVTIWSASRGMMGIERGLNRIINCSKRRNYVISRLINSGYTVVFILVCIMSLVLMVFGTSLQRLLLRYLPILEHIAPYLLSIRALIALAILIVFFMGLYTFLPFEKLELRKQLPGALFSTAGWIVCSYGFSIYFNHFKRFSYMYGSLAAIVILMLWLYFCICILFLGAEVNQHMHFGRKP